MASTPDLIGRNDTTLWAIGCMLEDIHDRAPDWDERPEDEHADFTLEWEGLLNRLEGVIQDDRDGTLTKEQRRRLREVAQHLTASREVILRIGLDYPDLSRLALVS
jgi:hypothetical protein